jgi:hypothetical protein
LLHERFLAPGIALQRFWIVCLIQWEEHLKAQAEGCRLSVSTSSINPTLQVALLLGGYSMSASCDTLFTCVASTYQKQASTIPPLDLPLVNIGTFLEGMMIFPDSGQFGGSSTTTSPCLHFQPLDLRSRSLTFHFVCAQENFLFWIPVHPARPQWCHDVISTATPTRRSGD